MVDEREEDGRCREERRESRSGSVCLVEASLEEGRVAVEEERGCDEKEPVHSDCMLMGMVSARATWFGKDLREEERSEMVWVEELEEGTVCRCRRSSDEFRYPIGLLKRWTGCVEGLELGDWRRRKLEEWEGWRTSESEVVEAVEFLFLLPSL